MSATISNIETKIPLNVDLTTLNLDEKTADEKLDFSTLDLDKDFLTDLKEITIGNNPKSLIEKIEDLSIESKTKFLCWCLHNSTNGYVTNMLGQIFLYGWGVEKNPKEAERYFNIAINNGVIYSVYNLGEMYLKMKEYDIALSYFLQAYEKGNEEIKSFSCEKVGNTYIGKKDYEKAREWYKKSILQYKTFKPIFCLSAVEAAINKEYSRCFASGNEVSEKLYSLGKKYLIESKSPQLALNIGNWYLTKQALHDKALECLLISEHFSKPVEGKGSENIIRDIRGDDSFAYKSYPITKKCIELEIENLELKTRLGISTKLWDDIMAVFKEPLHVPPL